ncbi:MAG: NADH dehydrogenase [Firmicutes bacterium]|nr:NADH dehydrogenase [Bacillota bacterium]
MLLIVLPAIPLVGVIALLGMRGKDINMPLIISSIILLLGSWGLKDVFWGGPLTYRLSLSGPYAPTFRADALSAIFVLLAAFLWWVVSIYAPEYMQHEGRVRSFYVCTLLTLSAVLGVFLAGDLFTMLLFFELMTIASFFWVIHRMNKEAIRAGYFYLFFSIVGGLFLALGIVLMGAATGDLLTIGTGPVDPLQPRMLAWALGLFVAGFGIKAGMVPLHLWLPHAHSVAPTPASALLSGLLIKVGAYGLIRTGELVGWGIEWGGMATWLGPALTVLGTCTMLVGVSAALLQSDAKRLLAYHSVSQMGYIILGLGVGLLLGKAGGLGLMGAIYHIVNHALFKAALFLGVGVIYVHTQEANLYNLGGLWRRFPVTAILMFLAVLGITGAPGLNGYASKTLLHHAVSAVAEGGPPWMVWVERLFLVVGVGTAASFTKLYYLIFLGQPTEIEIAEGQSHRLQLAMALLAVVMVGIGLKPGLFPQALAIPAAEALGMGMAHDAMVGFSFWDAGDVVGMLITLGLGMAVCWAGLRTGAFHWQPPLWLTLEGLVRILGHGLLAVIRVGERSYRWVAARFSELGRTLGSRLASACHRLDHARGGTIGGITLSGISADAFLLMFTLAALIVWYVASPSLRWPLSLPTGIGVPLR